MKRSSVVYAIVLMGLVAACGGDDEDKDTGKKNNSQEKAGSGASDDKSGVGCGSKVCKLPDGVMGEACCKDNFSSTCGVKMGSAGQCRDLPKVDERCPVPDIMVRMSPVGGMSAYGCCTSKNECGIDFGSGCQPRTIACMVIGPDMKDKIMHQTCDGDALPLPDDCATNMIRIPQIPGGAAGGGS
jgi:hypothetical protein